MDNLVDSYRGVNEVAGGDLRTILDLVWLVRWLVGAVGAVRRWWEDRRHQQHRQLLPNAC